jgi:small subunit ribosomal protein S11
MAKVSKEKGKKTKVKKKLSVVKIFLRAEFNNSIVTLTDLDGKVLYWSTSGKVGFKGAKKSTPFASQKATEDVLDRVKAMEASSAHIVIKGAGMGRDSFLRTIQSSDLQIESIKDITGFPFGGCKPAKRRRV